MFKTLSRRFSQAIRQARGDMTTPQQRAIAHWELWAMDHGFIRALYSNAHWVSPSLVRSAQPSPGQIKAWAEKGIRTILNLRGEERGTGDYLLEREACEKYGLTLISIPLGSREAPIPERMRRLAEIFATMEKPALLHCKSGADRAGLASVLYLHLCEGVPMEQARAQLSLRYGHMKSGRTGILDAFIDRYIEETRAAPLPFLDWLDRVYYPEAQKRHIRPPPLGKIGRAHV